MIRHHPRRSSTEFRRQLSPQRSDNPFTVIRAFLSQNVSVDALTHSPVQHGERGVGALGPVAALNRFSRFAWGAGAARECYANARNSRPPTPPIT